MTSTHPHWTEIAPGVHTRTLAPAGSNVVLVVGTEGAALVNCGADPQQGAQLRSEVGEVTDRPLRWVLLTDGAAHHAGGLPAFDDLTTIGHESLADADPGAHASAPNTTFAAARSINLGEQWLEAIHLGPARTSADVAIAVPAAGVVLAGDLVSGEADIEPQIKAEQQGWPDAVHLLVGMLRRDDQVLPGTGGLIGAAEVNRFGATIDRLLHESHHPEPAAEDDRPRLPLV